MWRDRKEAWQDAKFKNDLKFQEEMKEFDIEYLQKNLFKSLKIPPQLHGLKEDDVIGVKSLEITKENKDERTN
jgi:hypothetical protein